MAVQLYKKGATNNYVYISDDGSVFATYGEQVSAPNLAEYTLVGDAPVNSAPPIQDLPSDRKLAKYLAYLGANHSPAIASALSGYTP